MVVVGGIPMYSLSDDSQLVSSANETGEENGVGGRTEDITMDLLPDIFISQISLLEWEGYCYGQTDRQTHKHNTHTHRHTDTQTDGRHTPDHTHTHTVSVCVSGRRQ